MIKQRWHHLATAVLLTLSLVQLFGCGDSSQNIEDQSSVENQETSTPVIAATNAALASMTKTIVGEVAKVVRPQVEAESGQGLNVEEVLRLQDADLVFTNGLGANDAAWLDLISLDASRVHATTTDEFELSDFIQVEDYRTVHSHGDEGEHSHPWLVPQSWLNPRSAKAQSLSVVNRLAKTFPDQESGFRDRHRELEKELSHLEGVADDVAELIKAKKVSVIVSDPRLLFFTRSLKLEDNYLLWFDLPNSADAVSELRKRMADGKKKVLLLWAQDAGSLPREISDATDVESTRISLIEEEKFAGGGEFVTQLRQNFEMLKTALEGMDN